jgi:hypothetical protein
VKIRLHLCLCHRCELLSLFHYRDHPFRAFRDPNTPIALSVFSSVRESKTWLQRGDACEATDQKRWIVPE